MPKSRSPSRSKQPAADLPETPPVQAEVERAIAAVLARLKPKPARTPRSGAKPATGPTRRAGPKPLPPVSGPDD